MVSEEIPAIKREDKARDSCFLVWDKLLMEHLKYGTYGILEVGETGELGYVRQSKKEK